METSEEERLSAIQILDLSRNALNASTFQELTDVLFPHIRRLTNLQVLFLSHNKIDEKAAPTLLRWKKTFPNLYITLIETPLYGTGV